MEFFQELGNPFADERLGANLIAAHGVVTATVLLSLIVRRLVTRGSSGLARWSKLRWLETAGEEAAKRARTLLFWSTAAAVLAMIVAAVGYHLAGRDIRADFWSWYARLTAGELLGLSLGAATVLAVMIATWFAVRTVHRLRPALETYLKTWLRQPDEHNAVTRGLTLLQVYAVIVIRLLGLWLMGRIVGLGEWAGIACGFLLRVLTILMVARLLTLSSKLLTRGIEELGNRYLANGPFRQYWERIPRLFLFGERCFEAAVYVIAASQCVEELRFIRWMATYGPAIVKCIGIFFVSRVLIELLQVLLAEAFGLYAEDENADQKGRTLGPLLYSVSQYVIYFGSALVMLGVLEIPTQPILAGAGIIGLGVGLGAQSLVTDVVSGFFILFENQYLVGDYVQIGEASGTVEAVGIRVTQVRDGQGKLYIIPNGQIKGVVSYSKGYVNAVVDLRVPTGSDLEGIFRAMAEAGRLLRQNNHQVLADTQIRGLVDLGTTEMTVRAVTKVRPGTHSAMQNEYRRLLKQVLDRNASLLNPPSVAA